MFGLTVAFAMAICLQSFVLHYVESSSLYVVVDAEKYSFLQQLSVECS
jgi:hypothetical protein